MKKLMSGILVVVAALVVACNDDPDKGTIWDDPNFIRITVAAEKMNTASGPYSRSWTRADSLIVFDDAGVGHKLATAPSTSKAIFYTRGWSGRKPAYAVFSTASDRVTYSPKGVVGVEVANQQPLSALNVIPQNAIVAMGKISGNTTSYKIDPLRNITGLIKLSLGETEARSITVESIGGEILAGAVDIDCVKFDNGYADFWTPTSGKECYTSVTVTPEPDSEAVTPEGLFKAGVYYLALLPQSLSKGLRVKVLLPNGETLIRVFGAQGLTIPRSDTNAFEGTLDDTLPDVIQIDLNFYNTEDINPFGSFVEPSAQTATGEEYPYVFRYELDGVPFSKEFSFTISKGASNATYQHFKASGLDHKILIFGAASNAWIKLPGIPGRYLKSVSMTHGNTANKRFRLQENSTSPVGLYYSSPLLKASSLTSPVTETITFPTNGSAAQIVRTIEGKSYTMQFTEGVSLRVFAISLVYAKSLD